MRMLGTLPTRPTSGDVGRSRCVEAPRPVVPGGNSLAYVDWILPALDEGSLHSRGIARLDERDVCDRSQRHRASPAAHRVLEPEDPRPPTCPNFTPKALSVTLGVGLEGGDLADREIGHTVLYVCPIHAASHNGNRQTGASMRRSRYPDVLTNWSRMRDPMITKASIETIRRTPPPPKSRVFRS